jgi:nucleoside-diphosphate-sugar epimerase
MLIAVTGASGFLGRRLITDLVSGGHQVLAFGRSPRIHACVEGLTGVRYQVWDLTAGPTHVPEAVDGVVHCAALVSDWSPYPPSFATNVQGTLAVLRTFDNAQRFVHISTASVYDPRTPKRHVRESAPLPASYLNAYAATKMLGERAVLQSGRDAVILRPHAVYGPGDATLLPRALAARRAGRLVAVGNGHNLLSMTHVDNLVHAIDRALAAPANGCRVYNVADATAETLDTLLRAFLRAFRLPERIVYVPTSAAWLLATAFERGFRASGARRPPPLTRYMVSQLAHECTLDISGAVRDLGYSPTHTYATGFPAAARYAGVG